LLSRLQRHSRPYSPIPKHRLFGSTILLDWLKTYTYPIERRFSSLSLAQRVYTALISQTLSHGTTTAAYYATIHGPAINLLSQICFERGNER
jgi:guanine deaminase